MDINRNVPTLAEIFAPEGVLSKKIKGYSPRAIQNEMAVAIEKALDEAELLIVEAGTGQVKPMLILFLVF